MAREMKTKLVTMLEENLLLELRARAANEGRSIGNIIQDALLRYFHSSRKEAALRLAAVERLCSRPFNLSPQELGEIVEMDYHEL